MGYAAMKASLLSQISSLHVALAARCKSFLFLSILEGTDGKTVNISILRKLVL